MLLPKMKQTAHSWLRALIPGLQDDPASSWASSPCILWPFSVDGKGYGQLKGNRRRRAAHRESWELAHGQIPPGLHVLHHCDTPRCIRPSHLFLGTALDNLRDCSQKGRMRREGTVIAKLTGEEVRRIKARLTAGESQRSIARAFSVGQNAVLKIAKGFTWRYI